MMARPGVGTIAAKIKAINDGNALGMARNRPHGMAKSHRQQKFRKFQISTVATFSLCIRPPARRLTDVGIPFGVSMCRFLPEHLFATVGLRLQVADNVPGMALTFRSASSGRVD